MNTWDKEQYKHLFRDPGKQEFIKETTIYHKFYSKEEWSKASQQYLKKLIKNMTIEEYVETILVALDRLMDLGVRGETLHWIFFTWKSKLIRDIEEIVRYNKDLEYKSKSTKGIYEKNRKTIVPQIKKIIESYDLIKDIILKTSYNTIGTYEASISHSIKENHSIHNLDETAKIINELSDYKFDIKVTPKYYLDNVYDDYLHIEIFPIEFPKPLHKIDIVFLKEKWESQAFNQTWDLKHLIIKYLKDSYGVDGGIIGKFLFEKDVEIKSKTNDQNVKNIFSKKPKPKNRPENVELNRIIVNLDDIGIDEIEIAILINILENKERYKLGKNNRDETWSTKEGKYISLSKLKVKKAIRQRIKKMGGNFLKYQILSYIKERGECFDCDWKYNEIGNIIRIPCNKHRNSKSLTDSRFGSLNWQKCLLRRGLNFYSNALTFAPEQTKSKNPKKKKV